MGNQYSEIFSSLTSETVSTWKQLRNCEVENLGLFKWYHWPPLAAFGNYFWTSEVRKGSLEIHITKFVSPSGKHLLGISASWVNN